MRIFGVIAFGSVGPQRRFMNEETTAAQLDGRFIEAEQAAHFRFKTLGTISVLVRNGKDEKAVTLPARLGSLLRTSLEESRKTRPSALKWSFLSDT